MIREMGLCAMIGAMLAGAVRGEVTPAKGTVDSRVRTVLYDGAQVYRVHGHAGYQVDFEFEPGEVFVGLGAGDLEGLSYFAEENHLFLKPKAASVATNLTVLTNRRRYLIDYTSDAHQPSAGESQAIYALRFIYPPRPAETSAEAAEHRIDAALSEATSTRPRNADYWYCGSTALKPVAASDDGVHTRFRFAPNADLPAVFVSNPDGTESLLNFNMEDGDLIVHRVATRFIVRRGKLNGCIVNKGFTGGGLELPTETVAPDVRRDVHGSAR
jgi:type IV secretion system protein VirB9